MVFITATGQSRTVLFLQTCWLPCPLPHRLKAGSRPGGAYSFSFSTLQIVMALVWCSAFAHLLVSGRRPGDVGTGQHHTPALTFTESTPDQGRSWWDGPLSFVFSVLAWAPSSGWALWAGPQPEVSVSCELIWTGSSRRTWLCSGCPAEQLEGGASDWAAVLLLCVRVP